MDYQLQLVGSTYPGWRVLFYHDVAHALTRSDALEESPNIHRIPVPLLPRAISELGGRYYQADLHPETQIGDANFLEHPHRGVTTGQTGIIGSGCVIYPSTFGGLSVKVKQRHPVIGDLLKSVRIPAYLDPSRLLTIPLSERTPKFMDLLRSRQRCRIGSSVVIGRSAARRSIPEESISEMRCGSGTALSLKILQKWT